MIDPNVQRKIQKAMKVAIDQSETNEGKSAMGKVKQLLRKYDVTMDEVYGRETKTKEKKLLPIYKEKKNYWKSFKAAFVEIQKDEQVTFQIIPDPSVVSGVKVESLLNVLHSMKEDVMDRMWNRGFKFILKERDFASYRILYEKDRITFYLTVPKKYEKMIKNSLSNVFPKVAIVPTVLDLQFDPKKTQCAYVELRDHFFKATLVDRNQNAPMPSLMASGRNLVEGDNALLDISFIPVGRRWQSQARAARDKYRNGIEVKKKPQSLVDVMFMIADFISDRFENVFGFIDTMIGHEPDEKQMRIERSMNDLESATNQKSTQNGFDTVIRIASQSEDSTRAELTLRSIGTAFKDISLDNEFDIRTVDRNKGFIKRLQNNQPPLLRINGNIMGVPECSQLLQLPSIGLQEEYPEIERIDTLEVEAHEDLRKGGILLGEVSARRNNVKVYQPTDKKRWDDFVRTWILMGGQGQGKTSMLANLAIQAYLNDFGAMVIDAAKKEISAEIQHAVNMGIVKKEDFVRIDAGTMSFSLDWKEAILIPEDGKTRLSSTAIDFFKIEKDTTGQTGRFLRAMMLSMETGRMEELIEIMEDEDRLDRAISSLTKPEEKLALKTMQTYKGYSESQRRQVTAPIYNRLDTIMGDPLLAKCLSSKNEINMVDIFREKKIFVFDFSDEDLTSAQQDVFINLLFSKIDLAMPLRKKLYGEKALTPFFILCDEPAKYLRSSEIWEALTVQGRKWRIGFVWAFHYFAQLSDKFQKSIRDSLPHYFFFATSKNQWRDFDEEIKPFTLDNAMKLKAFHAICRIYSKTGYYKPFIAHMTPPPTIAYRKKKTG